MSKKKRKGETTKRRQIRSTPASRIREPHDRLLTQRDYEYWRSRVIEDRKFAPKQPEIEQHNKRVAKFASKHPDFHKVLKKADRIPLSVVLAELITTSKIGPAIMYYLAKHPARYRTITQLHPLSAARELGRIEAMLKLSS